MKVLRYGHLRSAPVVVDAAYTHGVGTAYTPCSVVGLHAPCLGASSMASSLSDDAQTRLLIVAVQDIAMRSLLLQAKKAQSRSS